MTFWGELTDGTELLLGEPMEAQLLYDSDAPASQLRAVFPAEKLWEDLAVVRVFHQGQVAFGGIVDEQNTALSGEGFTVELIARSWEALLLDNEARPAVLRSPSLGLLWERYFQPLGLTSVVGDQSPKAGELAVEKGTSCWELLESFCRDYLGTAPWVDGKGTLHCEGPQETKVTAGRVLSADEVLARYDAVTCEDILGLARETLDFARVSFSAVGRLRAQEEYEQLLKG